jgi:hypothetical protein
MLPIDSSSFPLTITKLTIIFVGLGVGGGMTMLGNLPNLRTLKIKWCNDIIDLHVFGGSFPRLEVLKLQSLEKLEKWKLEGNAMPCLRYFFYQKMPSFNHALSETMEFDCLAKGGGAGVRFRHRSGTHVSRMRVGCKLVIKTIRSGD